jgi:hypothetical protein
VNIQHSAADLARWEQMGQRHRILRAVVVGLMTVEGSTPEDIARSMRTAADLVEARRFEKALAEAAGKAEAAKSAASSQQGTPA